MLEALNLVLEPIPAYTCTCNIEFAFADVFLSSVSLFVCLSVCVSVHFSPVPGCPLSENDIIHHVKQNHKMLKGLPDGRICSAIGRLVETSQIYPSGENLYCAV